jgi:predicted MPP superfamily phosphohydrolase
MSPASADAPLDAAAPETAARDDAVPDTESDRRLSRRKFLRRAVRGLAAAAAGTFLYTWRIEPHWVDVVERPLPIKKLPSSLVGKRLIQLSDLHVGPVVDQNFLLRSAERLAELKPDLLVVTGDFMTCHGGEQIDRVGDFVRALPPAPLGRFGVFGNHDYGDHWAQNESASRLERTLDQLDLRLLRNDVADAAGLQIAGIDEFWAQHFDPPRAIGKLDADRPAIALCHNPDGLDQPGWDGYHGWVLAGHTHGGQCKAPFFRPPLTPVRNKRYVAGEYALDAGRRMYINRGLGYLRRVRFNCRPEITVFTLTRADA